LAAAMVAFTVGAVVEKLGVLTGGVALEAEALGVGAIDAKNAVNSGLSCWAVATPSVESDCDPAVLPGVVVAGVADGWAVAGLLALFAFEGCPVGGKPASLVVGAGGAAAALSVETDGAGEVFAAVIDPPALAGAGAALAEAGGCADGELAGAPVTGSTPSGFWKRSGPVAAASVKTALLANVVAGSAAAVMGGELFEAVVANEGLRIGGVVIAGTVVESPVKPTICTEALPSVGAAVTGAAPAGQPFAITAAGVGRAAAIAKAGILPAISEGAPRNSKSSNLGRKVDNRRIAAFRVRKPRRRA
jgi:hypothetical protein